jgi:NAD-dependent dihydropyrimidine dehydrogenase PreA subunit
MAHIITSLCLRDNGCVEVCPVECITPGEPANRFPTYFIDPGSCIDCGACVPECPYSAIFPEDEVPSRYVARGGEFINRLDLTGHYAGVNHKGKPVVLETTRQLTKGEIVDLTPSIKASYDYAR